MWLPCRVTCACQTWFGVMVYMAVRPPKAEGGSASRPRHLKRKARRRLRARGGEAQKLGRRRGGPSMMARTKFDEGGVAWEERDPLFLILILSHVCSPPSYRPIQHYFPPSPIFPHPDQFRFPAPFPTRAAQWKLSPFSISDQFLSTLS